MALARHSIAELGGAVAAIEDGFQKGEIERSAYATTLAEESGERIVVGVNSFVVDEEEHYEMLRIDTAAETAQILRLKQLRSDRDGNAVTEALARLALAAAGNENVCYPIKDALRLRATVGEVCDALREHLGHLRALGRVLSVTALSAAFAPRSSDRSEAAVLNGRARHCLEAAAGNLIPMATSGSQVADHDQIEPRKALGFRDDFDRGDPLRRECEQQSDAWRAIAQPDPRGSTVDDGELPPPCSFREPSDRRRTLSLLSPERQRCGVAAQHDIRIEQLDERGKVAKSRRRKERLNEPGLLDPICSVIGFGVLSTSSRPARQLARRRGVAPDDRRDVLKGDREHVVQHERDAFGRGEAVEHDQQCEAD